MTKISIIKDFTDKPGGRFISQGPNSGELFREKILKPKYEEAVEKNEELEIDLDGGYGYPTSFLEESFGGLARLFDKKDILIRLKFISNDQPKLIEEIKSYIEEGKN